MDELRFIFMFYCYVNYSCINYVELCLYLSINLLLHIFIKSYNNFKVINKNIFENLI